MKDGKPFSSVEFKSNGVGRNSCIAHALFAEANHAAADVETSGHDPEFREGRPGPRHRGAGYGGLLHGYLLPVLRLPATCLRQVSRLPTGVWLCSSVSKRLCRFYYYLFYYSRTAIGGHVTYKVSALLYFSYLDK